MRVSRRAGPPPSAAAHPSQVGRGRGATARPAKRLLCSNAAAQRRADLHELPACSVRPHTTKPPRPPLSYCRRTVRARAPRHLCQHHRRRDAHPLVSAADARGGASEGLSGCSRPSGAATAAARPSLRCPQALLPSRWDVPPPPDRPTALPPDLQPPGHLEQRGGAGQLRALPPRQVLQQPRLPRVQGTQPRRLFCVWPLHARYRLALPAGGQGAAAVRHTPTAAPPLLPHPACPQTCAAGAYSGARATRCINCQPGFTSASGSGACAPCKPGSYAPFANADQCSPCPKGYQCPTAGMR